MDTLLPQKAKTGDELVKVRLTMPTIGVTSGSQQYIGITFEIEPGWHIYWKNPGDSGAAPSWNIEGTAGTPTAGAPGIQLGEPLWPAPHRYESPGDILDYVYEGTVTIIVPFTVSGGPAGARISANWLVCKDVCLPGTGESSIRFFRPSGLNPMTPSEEAPLFHSFHSRIPIPADQANIDFRTSFADGRLHITVPGATQLIFFPHASVDMVAPTDAFHEGKADGDTLSIAYSEEAQNAEAITGVLEIHRADGTEAFVEVSVPGPAATGAAPPEESE